MPLCFFMMTLIKSLEDEFAALGSRQLWLLEQTSAELLFKKPIADDKTLIDFSVGGCVIRSGAMIEQAFMGITRRLWDDPFEWTLPEKLSTHSAIRDYLIEAGEACKKGMLFLTTDADLLRMLPAPEELRPIFQVLVSALLHAENYCGRASAILRMVSEKR
ncbi:MAG TPA: hypothetical protein VEV84_16555 [Pyrinomonadaceae bacterium]|nr:hypothetical protein [Pyrinomonadaceae bacterium]